MALTEIFQGLGAHARKGGRAEARYFVQGGAEVRLARSDFVAQGGEGSIYVRGATAYKVYSDPRRAIPREKVLELSALTEGNIIRPLELLLDAKGRAVGYTMRAVGKSYALCQLFPKAFRRRHGLTPEVTLRLVRRLQAGVRHVHARRLLVVDLNEMNFLVAEDFGEVFFIDVDSYQTPSYPAGALMESVRDRHARSFSTGSDWFSFAVVSFQMFVGIHPYKGTYPPHQSLADGDSRLDARMRANVSVLRPEVSVPASCLPFDVIPPAYLDWYRAVFEEGRRLPPPDGAQPSTTLAPTAAAVGAAAGLNFEFTLLREFDADVLWHDGPVTVTTRSIHFEGKAHPKPPADVRVAVTPRLRHLVAAWTEGRRPRLRDLTAARDLELGIDCDEIALCGGALYVRQRESVYRVECVELSGRVLPGLRHAANVMMNSTRMFDGLALQSMLGAYYASLFPAPGVCRQVRLKELDGYRIVDARLARNVLVAAGARGGRYDRLVFRFSEDFGDYDVRVVRDAPSTDVDCTVLETGLVLHATGDGALEVFPRRRGAAGMRTIHDPFFLGDARLSHSGARALAALGPRLYQFSMRRKPALVDSTSQTDT
jgi:hypothetical protein